MKTNKIENGRGYPDSKKEGCYYWVKRYSPFDNSWEICLWNGHCFLAYGYQTFEIEIQLPIEYVEIKKPK